MKNPVLGTFKVNDKNGIFDAILYPINIFMFRRQSNDAA
jgi:hypothetical protein